MSEAFERALAFVLAHEGAYAAHPSDPGGATNRGITQATYDAWRDQHGQARRSVAKCTMEETRAIYHARYWLATAGDQRAPALALCTFDAAVHSGVPRALKWAAGAGGDPAALNAARLRFLTTLSTWPVFGRGWARRIADLGMLATALTQEPPPRELLVYDETGDLRAVIPAAEDVLIRVTPTRVHARPDPIRRSE